MNIKKEIEKKVNVSDNIYINDIEIEPITIKTIMINEVVPHKPSEDFYGEHNSNYIKTVLIFYKVLELKLIQ